MRTRHIRTPKTALALAATLALLPTQSALAANCTWNPATGNWGVSGNWSCGAVPGTADIANIALGKVVTIDTSQGIFTLGNSGGINVDAFVFTLASNGSTTNTGTINVGSGVTAAMNVLSGHNIANSGGVINIATGSVVNQFGSSISGGTINTTGTGKLAAFAGSANFLSGVTLNGNLDMASNQAFERINGGFTLNGSVSLGANSILSFEGNQTVNGNGTITFADANGSNRLDVGGGNLVLASGMAIRGGNGIIGQQNFLGGGATLTNLGLISADTNGRTISINVNGLVTNQGTMSAQNGAALVLGGASGYNNTGGTILAGNGSVVTLSASSISGGVLDSAGNGSWRAIASSSNFINGATVSGVLDLASTQGFVRVSSGGMVINGAVNIGANSIFATEGAQTLSGSGNIVFADANGSNRFDIGAGTTTIAAGLTVRGGNGIIGQQNFSGGAAALINNGSIQADIGGRAITLQVNGTTTNNGTLAALNGGTLNLNSAIVGNAGSQIVAGAGSLVNQNSITISGNMNIVGTGSFRPNASSANFLNGVTLSGTLDMMTQQAIERVTGGLTLNNATINIGATSVFAPQGVQTIGGTGAIVFADANGNNRFDVGAGTLTLASGVTVRGGNGIIGTQNFSGGAAALVNNGSIQADEAGRNITLQVNGLTTNNGTLAALNGGTLNLNSAIVGNAGSQIVAGAGSVVNQNSITISGDMNIVGTGSFRPNASSANFLNGVTLSGTLDMLTQLGFERITNGLTLNNATINIGANSVFAPQGNQTISGTGNIVFADGNGNNRFDVGAGTLTLASGVTVRGGNGIIGTQTFSGGAAGLINQGVINADVSGRTITMQVNGVVTNQGTMGAQGGGTLALSTGGGYDNTAGTMFVDNGGTVLFNAATVTGGNLNSAGSGVFRPNASGSNFINGVTLNGVLDMATATSIARVSGGMVVNGTVNLGANSVFAPEGNQTISGSGNIVFADGNGNNRFDVGGGNLVIASGVTVRGQNGLIGTQNFVGGAATLTNNGTLNADAGGSITVNINGGLINNGTFRAQNGTLTVQDNLSGTGTLRADATGILNLANGGNTQGTLTMGAAGSVLNLGNANLTLNTDYTNVAAGTGNSFNRRAGVAGAGLIVAGGNAAQAITGAAVSNGATTNASLTIGNVRVNSLATYNYQVANTGSTGPSLRGAIQTTVNGANLTDPRLGGAGLAPSNYNTGAPGSNTGDLAVTFLTATPGLLAPLVNQKVNLTSNFQNIADQKLNLVLAAGAAAFNAAVGSTVPSPVVVANQRVGGSNLAALTVANTAPAGAFSEDLNASFGASTGNAGTNGGSISGLLAGATNSTAMKASVDTAGAGAKSGTVIVNYQTAGAVNGVSNGLGTASAGDSGAINVTGNVYLVAQPAPSVLPANFNLGNFHVGAGAQSQALLITNTSLAPVGFQEGLAAVVSAPTGLATGSGFANAAAGNQGALNMGVSAINAGLNTGTLSVQLQSNGITTTGSNGLGSLNLGTAQTVTVNANGYRLAQPNAIAPVNFGNVLANSVQTRTLTISNNATADGFSEALNAAFGVVGGTDASSFSGSGAISGLLAGISNNTNMVVTLNTSTTGTRTANVQILLDSNGSAIGNGLGISALPTQVINLDGVITANVGNLASAGLSPTTVNFGKFREGAVTQVQQLTITNLTNGPGEGLNASFGAASGGAANNGASIASLATGTSNNTTMSVSLTGMATAGPKSGTQVLNFASDGSFNNNVVTPLPAQSVDLSAQVYRLAAAGGSSAVALAARRVADAAATGSLSLSNTAAADGFSEGLRGTFGAAPGGFTVSGAAGTALIAAGASETRTVSLSTTTAGSFGGNVNIALASDGAGTSNFSALGIGSKDVALSGKVYTPAVGQLANTTLNFGVVRVGDVVAARNVGVNNTAATTALNDTLTANLSGATNPFSSGGSASGILAQGSGQIGVNLATTSAGVFNVNASVAFLSHNPDMADASAGPDAGVNILAQINNLANADFDLLSALGLLTQNGSDYVLDLGTITLGSNANATLQLDNDVLGPADVLAGAFDQSAVNDFSLGGWIPFAGLAAGQATGNLTISFLANALGAFDDLVVFNGRGTNASDPVGLAQTRRLIIRANVVDPDANPVPEPGSLALILAAALGALVARRRRAVH